MIQAVILLGGKGTRLSALYPDRPKALAPVAGRPFLERQLDWLLRSGITNVHLAAGFKADQIAHWIARREIGPDATVSTETEPLGTGGGLRFCLPFLRSERVFVLNGDSLAPRLDFSAMLRAHGQDDPARVTIAVTPIAEAGRYGTVEFDDAGRVTAFREKAGRTAGWVNAGVYLMHRSTIEAIPERQQVSLETGVFPPLAAAGHMFAHRTEPPLLDMGTPDGLRAMERYLKKI
jgi:NDP-sugar pyrophosphorylase family protein